MDTIRVNIDYRPLRVAWLVHSSDREGFRRAVRMSHVMWGGVYNPIVQVDRPEAKSIVEVFRPDLLHPISTDAAVETFRAQYPHLITPIGLRSLFGDFAGEPRASVLDLQNLLFHHRDRAPWAAFVKQGIRVPRWANDDPLGDAFLCQFGAYPQPSEAAGIDYDKMLAEATAATQYQIGNVASVPTATLDFPGLPDVARYAVQFTGATAGVSWRHPGFFLGDASSIVDLATFWNVRAAGVQLLFISEAHIERYSEVRPVFESRLRARLAALEAFRQAPAVWCQEERLEAAQTFAQGNFTICRVSEQLWNGLNLQASRIKLGDETALGVMGGSEGAPSVSFALRERPFSAHKWFYSQHLAASMSVFESLPRDKHVFVPPYVPELNEMVSRATHHDYSAVRLEPESLGVVIRATETDMNIRALSVPTLVEKVFDLAGLEAVPSGGGLITRQLITRMGGIDGTRAFKIPGVRRLLRTYGPSESFTGKSAIQLIGKRDPENPNASFGDHENLYIEPRPIQEKLTASSVFSHLVEKGLFRIGFDLSCPVCHLTSWVPLDTLQQSVTCQMCGAHYDATRQLVEGKCAYRRSGVLGLEKNTMGAVPVALVMQQLSVNVGFGHGQYESSYKLRFKGTDDEVETDFVIMLPEPGETRTALLIGEVKDAGGHIDSNDIENMRRVAKAVTSTRFMTYVVLAKLAAFTSEEVALAKTLNEDKWPPRVIMLTHRELEPYDIYDRTEKELNLQLGHASAGDLAESTYRIYFDAG